MTAGLLPTRDRALLSGRASLALGAAPLSRCNGGTRGVGGDLLRSVVTVLAVCLLAMAAGCHAIDFYAPAMQGPIPSELEPPRELSMVSLPAYRIETPDVLRLEVVRAVPRPTYRLEAYDTVRIRALGTLLNLPIDRDYLVEAEGIVNLGPPYGAVRVLGMTAEEAAAAIRQSLEFILQGPEVSVQLVHSGAAKELSDFYVVEPDGVVRLRGYGDVHVAGKTVAEARKALEEQLGRHFDSPRVGVEVVRYNSKSYYVIMPGGGSAESIHRFPIMGNETVLDAIGQIQQFSALSSKTMWVARAAPNGFGAEQILPVDWEAISRGGETGTNYQLMPGDRLYIVSDNLVAMNYVLGTVTNPVGRLLGLATLGTSTARDAETLGRSYNARGVFRNR
jgi:polysaccharide biosynthesis/export protein